ncbi:hypothetical protein AN9531.2 [Aspergillus nidulans FGSC A4]|jgi:hypothetical protein|uniref:NmrA-like domain-containing protein n=1 Tax=Emericella nidulans (strain FGSC A4 / ATCC 38163 / CBS 112.46 / NRRL 194 / M139) TaxID=227321 RepID=Q5AQ99_EMENI|nr:hypothetical protein [Aspergillus nidulans FGSC A4]EAA66731.1 hypothetical protein AN9531.2 [Aspergillus nidulans FGSC A4]CBF84309.1 TPA: conserved hypothetical protein [Aspergillus nidulans FGSC A4]|eukprot:XP_868913.1 hypothetical protein AN9531.2 [Aspergillus nidulans FGSC A4]
MSSQTKTIAVIGATGNQGFSTAESFLSIPNWAVRALTRNPDSATAQKLASMGCEVVQADLNDMSSLDTAFKGVHAIFVNTDFWATYTSDPARDSFAAYAQEVRQGKNAAIAASKVPSLERFVYSALPSFSKASGGKYSKALHCESKAAIVEYIETSRDLIELAKKSSFIYLGAYSTHPIFTPRSLSEDGVYQFIIHVRPVAKIPIIDAPSSTGRFVKELVLNEEPGTKLLAYDTDSYLSVLEAVEVWSRRTGEKAEIITISAEEMRERFGIPMEVLDAPLAIDEFGYMSGVEGYIEPKDLTSTVVTRSFEEWLNTRDWRELALAGEKELEGVKI